MVVVACSGSYACWCGMLAACLGRWDDADRARDLIAAGRAEAEQLGMARELVRFERLSARLGSA